MSLTATASRNTRQSIYRLIGMKKVLLVSQSPNKLNIYYSLNSKQKDLEEAFDPLIQDIKEKQTSMNRTIIFCRSYTSCTSIYFYFKSSLGKAISEPEGYPNHAELQIMDVFTACTHPTVKNMILRQFQQPDSSLQPLLHLGWDSIAPMFVTSSTGGPLTMLRLTCRRLVGLVEMAYPLQLNFSVQSRNHLHGT